MCWNYTEGEYRCNDPFITTFPCNHDCDIRGNYAYCKFLMTRGRTVACVAPHTDYLRFFVML
ncbi:hypothetical protein T02_8356, partial [Trichinella nativa]